MKIFLIFFLLNSSTGDIQGYALGGPQPAITVCHDRAQELIKANPPPKGSVVFPVCIDLSKVKPGTTPEMLPPVTKLAL